MTFIKSLWIKTIYKKIRHWFEERDVLKTIQSGEADEKAGRLIKFSSDLHELVND